jgi:hypothetical protein
MVDKRLAATDVLAFDKKHLCDPPPWFIRELDFRVLRELAINEVQMHKAILEAQVVASNRTLEILEQVKG